jgi:hypothetical protein
LSDACAHILESGKVAVRTHVLPQERKELLRVQRIELLQQRDQADNECNRIDTTLSSGNRWLQYSCNTVCSRVGSARSSASGKHCKRLLFDPHTQLLVVRELGHLRDDKQEHQQWEMIQRLCSDIDLQLLARCQYLRAIANTLVSMRQNSRTLVNGSLIPLVSQ